MAKSKSPEPPWKRDAPAKPPGDKSVPLTQEQKAEARERARKAGRPYPNLVDNMAVARKRQSAKKTPTSAAAAKTAKKR